jgi:hypothetical protein
VSTYFDAVVVAARQSALVDWLKSPIIPGPLAPINLELHRVGEGHFVVFGWRAGAACPDAWGELQALAYGLSLNFGTAVAVHFDDQVSERLAAVAQDGEPFRQFAAVDEVWVPYGENGELVLDGPRFSGAALPGDLECDCIRNGIDAALEAAQFGGWMTSGKLVDVACRNDPVWRRPGVAA